MEGATPFWALKAILEDTNAMLDGFSAIAGLATLEAPPGEKMTYDAARRHAFESKTVSEGPVHLLSSADAPQQRLRQELWASGW